MRLRFRRHDHAWRIVKHPSGNVTLCAICGTRP